MNAPLLSVIVNFHDMRREAARTLYTLAQPYQRDVTMPYEVLAVDNGSAMPLDADWVASHGRQFHLLSLPPGDPSPCAAINRAAAGARGEFVMVCIDGARMLSPGVLHYTAEALALRLHPFVYTLGMHLGHKPQNELMEEGYDQQVEDALLEAVDWRADGYRLFDVSSVAYSSRRGFFSLLSESNCFAMRREDFLSLGGLDPAFSSPGGGLANLDFFNRVHEDPRFRPIMLLGEASFHQFHGGVATNVPRSKHPWARMKAEYATIRGRPFTGRARMPEYLGWISPQYHARLVALDS